MPRAQLSSSEGEEHLGQVASSGSDVEIVHVTVSVLEITMSAFNNV